MPTGIYKRTKSSGMSGKHHTKEARKKVAQANKGKHYSPKTEFKKGQFAWNKGKHTPKITREKLSKSHKGNVGYWRNKKRPSFSREWRENMSQSHSGKKSYLWKGGITPMNAKIRNSLEIKLWKKAVFERDNFVCQKCEQKGGELEAHHIFNFADYQERRTEITNGITLCKKCHKTFHKKYGKKNNTREQLNKFLN